MFLTSDTHFGHTNIIKYCARPFASADEMDAELIRRWNSVVGVQDVVLHLGDFAFKSRADINAILAQLNGHIYLVMGNHDEPKKIQKAVFERVSYEPQSSEYPHTALWIDGNLVAYLSHYPTIAWSSVMPLFFGHIHTALNKKIEDGPYNVVGTYDVGVDNNDFTPVPFDVAFRKAWRE